MILLQLSTIALVEMLQHPRRISRGRFDLNQKFLPVSLGKFQVLIETDQVCAVPVFSSRQLLQLLKG